MPPGEGLERWSAEWPFPQHLGVLSKWSVPILSSESAHLGKNWRLDLTQKWDNLVSGIHSKLCSLPVMSILTGDQNSLHL